MFTLRIGNEERDCHQGIDEQWINQQINHRRTDGEDVCVRVSIHADSINIALATPTCPGGAMGGRAPNFRESELLDLWKKRGLNDIHFTGGNLIAFLKQTRELC